MPFKDWFDIRDENTIYIRNPIHGGKESCCVCTGFIIEDSGFIYLNNSKEYICEDCWKLQMNGLFK
jgi:hypothetical protein